MLFYGIECRTTKHNHLDKMEVLEMRMLRWVPNKTIKDQISNITIHAKLEVIPIEEKMREYRSCWFGYVQIHSLDVAKRYTMQFCQCQKGTR